MAKLVLIARSSRTKSHPWLKSKMYQVTDSPNQWKLLVSRLKIVATSTHHVLSKVVNEAITRVTMLYSTNHFSHQTNNSK